VSKPASPNKEIKPDIERAVVARPTSEEWNLLATTVQKTSNTALIPAENIKLIALASSYCYTFFLFS